MSPSTYQKSYSIQLSSSTSRRICSSDETFKQRSNELKSYLNKRGYNLSFLNQEVARVQNITRTQALTPKDTTTATQPQQVPLVITYNPALRYGWRNGAKFTKFIFIHIQCSYWYSRIYLFTFSNGIYIQEIYLFTFTCVFLIHDYIYWHLRDVFIHIQRVISIHIHDRTIHSAFSAHHLCASVSIKYGLRTTDHGLWTTDWV